jgi:hypothetical protein
VRLIALGSFHGNTNSIDGGAARADIRYSGYQRGAERSREDEFLEAENRPAAIWEVMSSMDSMFMFPFTATPVVAWPMTSLSTAQV